VKSAGVASAAGAFHFSFWDEVNTVPGLFSFPYKAEFIMSASELLFGVYCPFLV
jgi:hypothetical protein